ncbi:hypothetical protein TNCV_2501561 [Trichonephila clavipes]|nr:hypothetical protein TNCV_2501561 [Trichonephila clavipes]
MSFPSGRKESCQSLRQIGLLHEWQHHISPPPQFRHELEAKEIISSIRKTFGSDKHGFPSISTPASQNIMNPSPFSINSSGWHGSGVILKEWYLTAAGEGGAGGCRRLQAVVSGFAGGCRRFEAVVGVVGGYEALPGGREAVVKIYRFWNSGAGGARGLRAHANKKGVEVPGSEPGRDGL